MLAAGIDVNRVPYKSGADAIPDMLGGRIQLNLGTIENLAPLINEGKMRALVVTDDTRSDSLPSVPTMKEIGYPQLTRGFWAGLLAPAATPTNIVMKINKEVNASLARPDVRNSLLKVGVTPKGGSPEEFAALISEEVDAWKSAAKAAGISPQ
jgi:tripartite-type tricarboxylate transporter receptor subunit TctC